MADRAWKAWERRVAKLFGCRRRGADTGSQGAGKDDLTHEHYAVEVKLLSRPSWCDLQDACRQAEGSAKGREPLAVVKRKGSLDSDALVVMRLSSFIEWRL